VPQNTEFVFNRFSSGNPDIAIFKAEVADDHKEITQRLLGLAGVKENDNDYTPRHLIYIRPSANDTELPNCSLDFENWEVSCDWKGLYTAFWYEEKFIDTLDQRFLDTVKEERDGLSPIKPEAEGQFMFNALMRWDQNRKDNRKRVRRSRIARQAERRGREYWDDFFESDEEELIVKRVMDSARFGTKFSDDEEEVREVGE